MIEGGTGRRGGIGGTVRVAVLAAALVTALATAQAGEARADDVAQLDRVAVATLEEIAPGHFVHVGAHADMTAAAGGDVAVGGFIVGERAVAVIDPGGSMAAGRALRAALRARSDLPIRHLVLTHFHPDHVLGAAAFADVGDIVAHANYARARAQRGTFYAERFAPLLAGATLVAPSREIAPGESLALDLGGRRLLVRAHPIGHTDNDVTVHDVAGGVLWAGDLLFAGRTPALDGSLIGWLGVMDAIAASAPAVVVPGHGAPGPLEVIAGPQRTYLEALRDDARARLAAGGRLADAIAAAERADGGDWALFALQHPTNVTRAWTELEWE